MEAITCTQCGATLENVSERSAIVECEYCGARILMPTATATIKPPPPPPPVEAPEFKWSDHQTIRPMTIAGIAAALLFIPLFIVAFVTVGPRKQPTPPKVYSPPSTPYSYPTPAWTEPPVPAEPAQPVPVVNYQPRVAWDGPNDLEYFADPEVDISSLSNLTSEEVEKTVFKNRVVKLRVVINTEGEIDEVETISGHPILVQAATESAKKSIFSSRSKPTKRVLTYTFRVLKD